MIKVYSLIKGFWRFWEYWTSSALTGGQRANCTKVRPKGPGNFARAGGTLPPESRHSSGSVSNGISKANKQGMSHNITIPEPEPLRQ